MISEKEADKLRRLIDQALLAAQRAGAEATKFDPVDPRSEPVRKTAAKKKLREYLKTLVTPGPDKGEAP